MGVPIGNELVAVIGVTANSSQAAITEYFTTQQIANLGGGGGGSVGAQKTVSTGSTDSTLVANLIILWNSSTASPKTQTIPTSTGSLKTIIIVDVAGTAELYPITAVPVSGSLISTADVYTNNGSITLIDTSLGWVSL